MGVVTGVVLFIRAMFASRATIAAENLALRHQLGVLQRSVKRPQLRQRDRIFWVWLSRLWSGWCDSLAIVRPETVVLPIYSVLIAGKGLPCFEACSRIG
jgi:putative transposase